MLQVVASGLHVACYRLWVVECGLRVRIGFVKLYCNQLQRWNTTPFYPKIYPSFPNSQFRMSLTLTTCILAQAP